MSAQEKMFVSTKGDSAIAFPLATAEHRWTVDPGDMWTLLGLRSDFRTATEVFRAVVDEEEKKEEEEEEEEEQEDKKESREVLLSGAAGFKVKMETSFYLAQLRLILEVSPSPSSSTGPMEATWQYWFSHRGRPRVSSAHEAG